MYFVSAQIHTEIQIEIHQAANQDFLRENRALLLFPPLFFGIFLAYPKYKYKLKYFLL